MSESSAGRVLTVVTVVHAPACHFCSDAARTLAELAMEFPLDVEVIAADEPRSVALMATHRAPMYPLILVDDVFFSFGRLSRKKLAKLLASRTVAVG